MSHPEVTWTGPARVRDLMSTGLRSVGPDETLGFAMELMVWGGVRHLPVVENGRLVGILSVHDLPPDRIADRLPELRESPVRDHMQSEVRVADPDDDVAVAAARMALERIHSLPVVKDDKLLGILTSTDVLAERGGLVFKAGPGAVPSAATLMSAPPITFRPEERLVSAALTMTREEIRHAPVVDEEGRVVGMLSDRDLRVMLGDPSRLADREDDAPYAETLTVGDAMSTSPVVVLAEASLFEIARCFLGTRVGALPVVDDQGAPVGIVSYLDVLGYLVGS